MSWPRRTRSRSRPCCRRWTARSFQQPGVGMSLASGKYEKVPVIEGCTTSGRSSSLYVIQTGAKLATEMDYETAAAATLSVSQSIANTLIAPYPLASYMMDPNLALTAAGTDFVFACPGRVAAGQLSANKPTYAYEFSATKKARAAPADPHGRSDVPVPRRACGRAPVPSAGPALPHDGRCALRATSRPCRRRWSGYWTQFAKTGDPNVSSNPM